jgi:peptidoglycan/xylan/chitin deacetylase (PgdA/CDA1 family)
VPALHLAAFLLCAAIASGAGREVAITIDDLPRGGDGGSMSLDVVRDMTGRLLAPFREQKIPVIGFVNGGKMEPAGLREILDMWLDAGAELGNHTYSHPNINQARLEDYEADILKGEPVLRAALDARGKKLEFFRHPFLFTGKTPDVKRKLQAFLKQHEYRVAPVTLDNGDYEFAEVFNKSEFAAQAQREYVPYMESIVEFFEKRSVEVAGREFPQILLIHANELNARMMPELIAMFRRRGYSFVTLDHALKDEIYQLPEEYAGTGGFSWIHRWSKTKGMPPKGEPDLPPWIGKAYAAR